MRPLCLRMTAFGPYVEEQTIDFTALEGRTLFLITGPTGAGKTTLFDAIAYALYGESSGQERDGEALRSDFAPPGLLTEVVFDFSLKGRAYQVKRSPKQLRPKLRGNGLAEQGAEACLNFTDEPDKLPVVGIREVNERIVSLLGLKYEQFRQIMMIPQGEFRELLVADSKEREAILQKLFGTEYCAALQNELQQQEKDLADVVRDASARQDQMEVQLLDVLETAERPAATDARIQLANAWQDAQRQALARQTEALQELKQVLTAQQALCAKAKADNDLLAALQQSQAAMAALAEKQEAMQGQKKQLERAEAAQMLEPQKAEGVSLRQELNAKIQARQTAEQDKERAETALKAAAQALAVLEGKEPEREAARREIARLEALQPRIAEWETLQRQVEEQTAALAKGRQAVADQEAALAKIAADYVVCEQQAKEKPFVQQRLQACDHDKERLQNYIKKQEEAEALRLQTAALNQQKAASEQQALLAKERREKADKRLLDMREAYFSEAAAMLARNLEAGLPCPVCGAKAHPAPAVAHQNGAADEAALAAQEKQVQLLREQELQATSGQAALQASWQAAIAQVARAGAALAEAGEKLPALPETSAAAKQRLAELVKQDLADQKRLSACEQAEKLLASLAAQKKELEQAVKAAQDVVTQLNVLLPEKQRQLAELERQLPEGVRSSSTLSAIIRTLANKLAGEQQALANAQQESGKAQTAVVRLTAVVDGLTVNLADLERQIQAALDRFTDSCRQNGFADLRAYKEASALVPVIGDMKLAVQRFEADWQRQAALLDDCRKKAVGATWQDYEALAVKLTELQAAEQAAQAEQGRLLYQMETAAASLAKVVEHRSVLAERQAEYALVADLAKVSRGLGTNTRKISFERYVLAAYFEEVLQAANSRLRQMTNSRYEMLRRQEQNKGAGQSGLDIDVLDNYTGRVRPAKTLSGGESFKASLALALGLADVVQAHAGGVSLDTMFIDEGFGTLDPESLDGAIRCLIELQRNGRLVGIISHVPELKETIDVWLLVESARSGSRANFCIK